MSSIAYSTMPFTQCDSDSQTVTTTGGTIAALFTNLAFTKGRGLLIQNRGSVNVLFGKSAAAARWPILPGGVMALIPKNLTIIAIKAESLTATVDVFFTD